MNKVLGRFMSIMAVVFFVAAIVSAWRVTVADGEDIWYVPLLLALAAGAMTVGALRQRKRREE